MVQNLVFYQLKYFVHIFSPTTKIGIFRMMKDYVRMRHKHKCKEM